MTVVKPPVVYRNSRAVAVFYAVPFSIAQELLGPTRLFAVRVGEVGIVNVSWFDYAESSIGAYRELSLGIVASPEQRRFRLVMNLLARTKSDLGSFVLALPVDSELARVGGREYYGLPKTMASFHLRWSKSMLSASLIQDDTPVLSMEVPLNFGVPVSVREMVVFSERSGQLVTTHIPTEWPCKLDLMGRPKLKLAPGNHPLTQLAGKLGLQSARPLVIVHGPLEYARLPEPEPGVALTDRAPNVTPLNVGATEEPGCPPTPRSAEMSFSPFSVQPQVLQPAQHPPYRPAAQDNAPTDASSPESVGPATIRSRFE